MTKYPCPMCGGWDHNTIPWAIRKAFPDLNEAVKYVRAVRESLR